MTSGRLTPAACTRITTSFAPATGAGRPVMVYRLGRGKVQVVGATIGARRSSVAAAGLVMFYALAFGSVLLLSFITPALTTGSVSGERERRIDART